ncbi:MAG TPA: hypothetical protein VD906_03870 [Caulobacteraceae bacterium]|nr:hypothetical protein [Caulobacteraceae bacterium]
MLSFNHALRGAVVAVALLTPASSALAQSDAQIRQKIIKESIASYPGNCPCPYNSASNGSSCGRRSAYSRGGGYAPVCYASDVTPEMIREYKARRGSGR